MKKFLTVLIVVCMLVCISSVFVYADIGPKASLKIVVENIDSGSYYLDLLSTEVKYDKFNDTYPESYKEMPLYKYNDNGWLATRIRQSLLWINEPYENEITTGKSLTQTFTYFFIPEEFKVILQDENGNLFVSNKAYVFDEFTQVTTLDFKADMAKVEVNEETIKLVLHTLSGKVKVKANGTETIVNGEKELTYTKGTQIELKAQPVFPAVFLGWTGTYESTNPELSFTMEKDVELTAGYKLGENLKGDINVDGVVDAVDFALIRLYLLDRVDKYSDLYNIGAADVNSDDAINAMDLALVRQYLLGIINEL